MTLSGIIYGPDGNPLLPAAAPLADGAANPTTAAIDARLSAWNGATWDRLKATGGQVQARLYDSAGGGLSLGTDADAQATANELATLARSLAFNGSTWDRQYNNEQVALLASAARTANTSSAMQTAYNARGVMLLLVITSAPNTAETLTLGLYTASPADGTIQDAWALFASAAGSTMQGNYPQNEYLMVYPGADGPVSSTNRQKAVALALPGRSWYANLIHSGASSWTYALYAVNLV